MGSTPVSIQKAANTPVCIYGVHMITAVMAVWLRAGVRRALGWSAAHPRAHVWSAQTGRPPAYLWFWWLLAVAGDVCSRTGLLASWAKKGVGARQDDDTNPQIEASK